MNQFASLEGLPIRIATRANHKRAMCWILCYFVLHNFLAVEKEDDKPYLSGAVADAGKDSNDKDGDRRNEDQKRVAGQLLRDSIRE